LVLSTPTWRANGDWGSLLGYEADDLAAVNRRVVEFLEAVKAGRDDVVIEGCIGPRSDGYSPTLLMDAREAEEYTPSSSGRSPTRRAPRATAFTLTYVDEAVGIVRAATSAGLPVHVGFTVETDGRLPSGESIEDAIVAVDNATEGAAQSYGINCAHPTHFADALPEGDSRKRIRGLPANAYSQPRRARRGRRARLGGPPRPRRAVRRAPPRTAGARRPRRLLRHGIRHVTAICDAWLAADAAN
jgi:S-methylmethionine-dependent homocysteine/selenocysteine methylase